MDEGGKKSFPCRFSLGYTHKHNNIIKSKVKRSEKNNLFSLSLSMTCDMCCVLNKPPLTLVVQIDF